LFHCGPFGSGFQEDAMTTVTDDREFVSPARKLVRFFLGSRDKWKGKCQAAKAENKLLKNQTRAVERSRDVWKKRAQEQARRVAELERELQKIPAAAH
jgi:hypothetical protein